MNSPHDKTKCSRFSVSTARNRSSCMNALWCNLYVDVTRAELSNTSSIVLQVKTFNSIFQLFWRASSWRHWTTYSQLVLANICGIYWKQFFLVPKCMTLLDAFHTDSTALKSSFFVNLCASATIASTTKEAVAVIPFLPGFAEVITYYVSSACIVVPASFDCCYSIKLGAREKTIDFVVGLLKYFFRRIEHSAYLSFSRCWQENDEN